MTRASLTYRHVWLIALLRWIRGDESTPGVAAVSRLQTFMVAVEEQPVLARLQKAVACYC
jgi:hypothetical protein